MASQSAPTQSPPARPWAEVAAEKRAARDAQIPSSYLVPESLLPSSPTDSVLPFLRSLPTLSPAQQIITSLPVETLLSKLASGQLKAQEVTEAFIKRAVAVHQLTNCFAEVFFARALEQASKLDEYREKTGKVVGSLHGLPISLKDQLKIGGVDCTMGYVAWIGHISTQSSVLVDVLERAGAVPFCKTNVPQNLMRGETENNIFGLTTNPHNRSLTPGGSSGGEGALVGAGGSPLGVGTDIGGSVRIPSAFSGTWGFRPSAHRIPYFGAANSMEGQESTASVLGPLSLSHGGLVAFMKAVLSEKPWLDDPVVMEKGWDEGAYNLAGLLGGDGRRGGGRLCFGFMWDDGVVRCHAPVRRGMEYTKKALEAAGHEVIDWQPLNHREGGRIISKIFRADGGQDIRSTCAASGEPVLPGDVGKEKDTMTVYESWQINKQKVAFQKAYLDHWNASAGQTSTGRPVDGIICPVAPYVAPPHGGHTYVPYTSIFNLLDYPSVVFPTGLHCSPTTLDRAPTTRPSTFLSSADEAIFHRYCPAAADVDRSEGNDLSEGKGRPRVPCTAYANAPIGLQCVGRRGREEETLGLAKVVDEALEAVRKTAGAGGARI